MDLLLAATRQNNANHLTKDTYNSHKAMIAASALAASAPLMKRSAAKTKRRAIAGLLKGREDAIRRDG
jgi:hypothetical protein